MYVFLLICFTGFQLISCCRFGNTPNCAFQCRCASGGSCDEQTGVCDSGDCKQVPPKEKGYGWKEEGCRVGNVAYEKNTSQSGINRSYSSDRAVDGNTDAIMEKGSCAHPFLDDYSAQAWWMVDLGTKYTIREIVIFNRNKNKYRTNYFIILVGMTPDIDLQDKCQEYSVPTKERYDLSCTTRFNSGRYVTIKRTGGIEQRMMNICEVVIIGHETIECSASCLGSCHDVIGCDICANGTKQPDCVQDCDHGYWGENCRDVCGNCANSQICQRVNGTCISGCMDWYISHLCNIFIDTPSLEGNTVELEVLSASEIDVSWMQYNARQELLQYYLYEVEYITHGNIFTQTVRHDDSATQVQFHITGLTFNTLYDVKIVPYRYQDSRSERGIPTLVMSNKTFCIEPSQPVLTVVNTESQWKIISSKLSELESGCDSIAEYNLYISGENASNTLWTSSVYNASVTYIAFAEELNRTYVWASVINNKNLTKTSSRVNLSYTLTGQLGKGRSKKSNTAIIAGSTVGIIVVLIVVSIGVFFVIRYIRRGSSTKNTDQIVSSTTALVTTDNTRIEEPAQSILVSKLANYIKQKQKDIDGFKHEYASIPTGCNNSVSSASGSSNISKNRFKNIKAYDNSRVKLEIENEDPCTDYINASFITGYEKNETHYIAGQGPLPHTMTDTWRMVWQYNIGRIVMLTNLREMGKRKCERYWPEKAGDLQQYGDITVQLEDVEEYADFTIRRLTCSNSDNTKSVVQCHYTSWPDKQGLDVALPLLKFRHKVKTFPERGPLLIHCSAGIGRTGTYIAIDYLIEQGLTENRVDVYQRVTAMRENRMNMVQTLAQYEFIYKALLEVYTFGDGTIPCGELASRSNSLSSKMAEQYKIIDKWTKSQQHGIDIYDGHSQENRLKNKDNTIIPDDLYRPYLKTPFKGHNDYINAVYVNSYSRAKACIVTQFPLGNTVIDFWRLVYDCDCCSIVSLGMIGKADTSNEECIYENFEAKTSTEKHGPIEVVCNSETRDHNLTKRCLDVEAVGNNNGSIKTTQIEMAEWNGDDLPQFESFMELIKQVEHVMQELDGPTIICCSNGSDKSGLLVAALYMTDYMKLEQELDVVTAVRSVRKYRNQFVGSQQQYEYLYKVAQAYNKMFSTYANIM